MKVISLLTQKGGVGKTTLTLHWAVEAHRQQIGRIAIIDMDLQESVSRGYQRRTQDHPIVLKATADTVSEAVTACANNGIDLVLIDTMPRVEASSMAAARIADLADFQIAKGAAATAQPELPSTPDQSKAAAADEYTLRAFRMRKGAAKQLALLKVYTERTQNALVAEALNVLFERHNLPPVA